ncbi:MAG: hypothetical protein ACRDJN_29950 [Chloroflexota bacterium]
MISRVGGLRAAPRKESALSWWLAPAVALLWRLPLLLILGVLTIWYGFRGLAHLAFLFDRYPFITFLFAFALLPFAAAPAYCFYALIQYVPRLQRAGMLPAGRLALVAVGGPVVAFILAVMIDLVQMNLLRIMDVPPPRLPFDPY